MIKTINEEKIYGLIGEPDGLVGILSAGVLAEHQLCLVLQVLDLASIFESASFCTTYSILSLVFTVVLVTDVLLQLDHDLEQLTCQSARQGSQLHRIQKTTENVYVSD